MPDASFVQSSFLGGRFSPQASGRIDLPEYKTALAECKNGVPLEEGSWQRRSGTWVQGRTVGGSDGQIVDFRLPNNQAAILEITPGTLRIWLPGTLLSPNVFGYGVSQDLSAPYWSTVFDCQTVRVVQADDIAFLFRPGKSPIALLCTNYTATTSTPNFTLNDPHWEEVDGPYNDPLAGLSQTNNSLGAVDGNSFTPIFTITDGAYTFVSTDVNRAIRLWSQPPPWDGGHTYAAGDYVTYQGTFWRCLLGGATSVGIVPGSVTHPAANSGIVPTQPWGLAPTAGEWSYGFITSLNSGSSVNVTLVSPNSVPTVANGLVIDTWQLGTFTDTVWPTCGTYHEGRLWLFGAVPNRFDACVTNTIGAPNATGALAPSFSPTDVNGNVFDNSAISYIVNSTGSNEFLWAIPDHNGIIAGTASGEWLITASALNDPLTPTSIQAHRTTSYKSQNSEPCRMGVGIAFIQSFGRRLIEYVVDVFSQKFIGRHLNQYAKDLTTNGIKRICYQEELAPVIWCVTNSNQLIGCTYRRLSNFGQEAPVFMAWHQHVLGLDREVTWACMATDEEGTEDVLALLTKDSRNVCRLELMRPLYDANQVLWSAWYLDGAYGGSQITASILDEQVIISGLSEHNGNEIGVFLAGLWCGTFTVEHGLVQVPYGSDPDGKLNLAWLAGYDDGTNYSEYALAISNGEEEPKRAATYTVPCIVGYPFESQGKMMRPQTVDQIRTTTGPGIAKTRRWHQYGVQLADTITGAIVAIDGGVNRNMNLVADNQRTQLDHTTLFSGVFWDTLDGNYTFDGQFAWAQSDPYPLTITAISGFLHTQDR